MTRAKPPGVHAHKTSRQAPDWGPSVLIIDEDQDAASALARALRARRCSVKCSRPQYAAAQVGRGHGRPPDVVIMEIAYDTMDGLGLVAELRAQSSVPILVWTATRRADDATVALTLGADGIVRKPVDPAEVAERIRALVRRGHSVSQSNSSQLRVGSLMLDQETHEATVGQAPLHLTPTEFRVLLALATSAGQVIDRDRLAQAVWGYPDARTAPSLSTHLQNLRARLRPHGVHAPRIVTVKNAGYSLLLW